MGDQISDRRNCLQAPNISLKCLVKWWNAPWTWLVKQAKLRPGLKWSPPWDPSPHPPQPSWPRPKQSVKIPQPHRPKTAWPLPLGASLNPSITWSTCSPARPPVKLNVTMQFVPYNLLDIFWKMLTNLSQICLITNVLIPSWRNQKLLAMEWQVRNKKSCFVF